MSVNVGFYTSDLNVRGTTQSIYNYAKYNQLLLGNKSFIFYDKHSIFSDRDEEERKSIATNTDMIKKFKDIFENVIALNKFEDIDVFVDMFDIKILFLEVEGSSDNKLSKIAKNIVHCVFNCNNPRGDVYCSISPWVHNNNGRYQVIPYMVDLPEHNDNMRDILNIPDDAIVYGRIGGYYQFDIEYAQEAVYEYALNNPNTYFIFVCSAQFCPTLKNIIHLDVITNDYEKREFINTCDAMIHGRKQGETFGMAIAEFSVCNKPVISSPIGDPAHTHYLREKGIWYNNKNDLLNTFNTIQNIGKEKLNSSNWITEYCKMTPKYIMEIFNDVVKKIIS